MTFKIPDLEYNYELMEAIKELGKHLCSINLLIAGRDENFTNSLLGSSITNARMIECIIEGCPKLKTLTLESLRGWKESPKAEISNWLSKIRPDLVSEFQEDFDLTDAWDLTINEESLKALSKGCKELKDLKFTKISFEEIFTEDEIKKILPGCNVEIKECHYGCVVGYLLWRIRF